MKIDYKETTSDLITRINIHDSYGSKIIDEWMLSILDLKPGMDILDVGCGAGKQCFSFYDALIGNANITGGDVSTELLKKAQEENKKREEPIHFLELDFNKPFQFNNSGFDLVSCCFAIYYAENIEFTIKEMHRVLKDGGILFTTGPMPENKKVFYEIISAATTIPIPPMPGSSRYASEILDTIKSSFSKVKVEIFENPLTFKTVEPFLAYTRASLSEDRKLWSSFFKGKEDFENLMARITDAANEYIKKNGTIVMTKVVGGIIAEK